jgi:small subunit ribosomal protein S1
MSEEMKSQDLQAHIQAQSMQTNEQQETSWQEVISLKRGDTVKGKIVKVDDDQAYVDIGYKYDGIIPIQELSSNAIEKASNVVQIGDEVELKVLNLDDQHEKLVLSKRVVDREQAWPVLQSKLESQEILEAKVVEVVKGGLVVDIGMRGFVPASMVERNYVDDFSGYVGKTLRLKVKEIDRDKNKVILSQKEVLDEEFATRKKEVLHKIKIGQLLEGKVERIVPFGVFVDIGGIDGLIHISELAWHHIEQPTDVVKVGDKVDVKVLKIDFAQEKISLSMKETTQGPWDQLQKQFKIGDVVAGKVTRLTHFGAFVEIIPGVEGLVHISQISHRHIGTPHEVLKVPQNVNMKILDIQLQEKRISLSIKETEDQAVDYQNSQKVQNSKSKSDTRANSAEHQKPFAGNQHVSFNQESLTTTLGERLGDKLKKFNK